VLALVGADVPGDLPIAAVTERQADAVNEDWIRRYRELGRPG